MGLASLNLSLKQASDHGVEMAIRHPAEGTPLLGDDGEPAALTLRGKDSDAFIKAQNEISQKSQDAMIETGKLLGAAQREYELARTYAICTVGWHNVPVGWIEGSDDETLAEFSVEAAHKLYLKAPWVREQVDRFIGNRANFLKA